MAEEKKHPIQGVMDTSIAGIKEMVDANTVIGKPINCADGTMIIPVSKVGFGFASGGSDFATKAHMPPNSPAESNLCFGGGSGAGVTVTPVSFLVVSPKSGVSLLTIDNPSYSAFDKLIDAAPNLIEKAKELFGKKKAEKEEKDSPTIDEIIQKAAEAGEKEEKEEEDK